MEFMIQLYLNHALEAIELYSKAFQATKEYMEQAPDHKVLHCELLACGQKIAIAEKEDSLVTGNVHQIVVRMKKEEKVREIYEILKEDSKTITPLGPVFYSPCMVDFIDKFGVRWCLFAE